MTNSLYFLEPQLIKTWIQNYEITKDCLVENTLELVKNLNNFRNVAELTQVPVSNSKKPELSFEEKLLVFLVSIDPTYQELPKSDILNLLFQKIKTLRKETLTDNDFASRIISVRLNEALKPEYFILSAISQQLHSMYLTEYFAKLFESDKKTKKPQKPKRKKRRLETETEECTLIAIFDESDEVKEELKNPKVALKDNHERSEPNEQRQLKQKGIFDKKVVCKKKEQVDCVISSSELSEDICCNFSISHNRSVNTSNKNASKKSVKRLKKNYQSRFLKYKKSKQVKTTDLAPEPETLGGEGPEKGSRYSRSSSPTIDLVSKDDQSFTEKSPKLKTSSINMQNSEDSRPMKETRKFSFEKKNKKTESFGDLDKMSRNHKKLPGVKPTSNEDFPKFPKEASIKKNSRFEKNILNSDYMTTNESNNNTSGFIRLDQFSLGNNPRSDDIAVLGSGKATDGQIDGSHKKRMDSHNRRGKRSKDLLSHRLETQGAKAIKWSEDDEDTIVFINKLENKSNENTKSTFFEKSNCSIDNNSPSQVSLTSNADLRITSKPISRFDKNIHSKGVQRDNSEELTKNAGVELNLQSFGKPNFVSESYIRTDYDDCQFKSIDSNQSSVPLKSFPKYSTQKITTEEKSKRRDSSSSSLTLKIFELIDSHVKSFITEGVLQTISNLEKHSSCSQEARDLAKERVISIILKTFKHPAIYVSEYGSSVTNLLTPFSDLDLAIRGCVFGNREKCLEMLNTVYKNLGLFSFVVKATPVFKALIPVLKIEIDTSIPGTDHKSTKERFVVSIDVIVEQLDEFSNTSTAIRTTDFIKSCTIYYKTFYKNVLFLKYILNLADFNDSYKGGLNSYGLSLLYLAFIENKGEGNFKSLGDALISFIRFMAEDFNPNTTGVFFGANMR